MVWFRKVMAFNKSKNEPWQLGPKYPGRQEVHVSPLKPGLQGQTPLTQLKLVDPVVEHPQSSKKEVIYYFCC